MGFKVPARAPRAVATLQGVLRMPLSSQRA
jgi:hypothetical protein